MTSLLWILLFILLTFSKTDSAEKAVFRLFVFFRLGRDRRLRAGFERGRTAADVGWPVSRGDAGWQRIVRGRSTSGRLSILPRLYRLRPVTSVVWLAVPLLYWTVYRLRKKVIKIILKSWKVEFKMKNTIWKKYNCVKKYSEKKVVKIISNSRKVEFKMKNTIWKKYNCVNINWLFLSLEKIFRVNTGDCFIHSLIYPELELFQNGNIRLTMPRILNSRGTWKWGSDDVHKEKCGGQMEKWRGKTPVPPAIRAYDIYFRSALTFSKSVWFILAQIFIKWNQLTCSGWYNCGLPDNAEKHLK